MGKIETTEQIKTKVWHVPLNSKLRTNEQKKLMKERWIPLEEHKKKFEKLKNYLDWLRKSNEQYRHPVDTINSMIEEKIDEVMEK